MTLIPNLRPGDRVAIALSGGVDSAVAAALVVERVGRGRAFGISARLRSGEDGPGGCCDKQVARDLCATLGIEHFVVDLAADFATAVQAPFLQGYADGLTPNPCLACNRFIKFGLLWDHAQRLGADRLATGHYAQLSVPGEPTELGPPPDPGRFALHRGADADKDQSYMLLGLSQQQLSHSCFPLGALRKADVVARAQAQRLPFARAPGGAPRESQDVCFLTGELSGYLGAQLPLTAGPILDVTGQTLGTHRGLPLYTVGQRRGLRLGGTPRLYVIAKDPTRNALIVGERRHLCRLRFRVTPTNWVSLPPPEPGKQVACVVEVRYRGAPMQGLVTASEDEATEVVLSPHEQAVAPGQGAAFYDHRGWLLGGGPIGSEEPRDR